MSKDYRIANTDASPQDNKGADIIQGEIYEIVCEWSNDLWRNGCITYHCHAKNSRGDIGWFLQRDFSGLSETHIMDKAIKYKKEQIEILLKEVAGLEGTKKIAKQLSKTCKYVT